MSHKRTISDIHNFEGIEEPAASASLHRVSTSLSPIKKGRTCNYFDGTVNDGMSKLRIVGFTSKQQKAINALSEKKPIELKDCKIKPARRGQGMEVMLKSTTESDIKESAKEINMSSFNFDDLPTTISLQDLSTKRVQKSDCHCEGSCKL